MREKFLPALPMQLLRPLSYSLDGTHLALLLRPLSYSLGGTHLALLLRLLLTVYFRRVRSGSAQQ